MNEFDLRTGQHTGRTRQHRVDAAFPNALIGDLTALDQHRFVLIERDDFQGVQSQHRERQQLPVQWRALDGTEQAG